ncbi:MAG: flagellar basal-body MS-ring/collar protein FliF [Sphingomonadaceae bacterium]
MGDLIARLKVEGPQVWRKLTLLQKGSLVAVALGALAAIFFLTQWAQRTEYSALFTKLNESDAGAIVAKLKEQKIPYELADGGATVRVPADRVHEVRLDLASQGLPKGSSVGYELFDKMSFGLTDFAQKLNYQRALEGELARTISTLSGVQEARVHIVIPQDELFAAREKPATASVMLRLKAGTELDARQIRGVVNLVSRSVEGLEPENVTVVDGDGVTLSGQDDKSLLSSAGNSAQREAQKNYERALQQDIQTMLEQVLGPRKAVVRVSATLDWDQIESSSETYSPADKPSPVRSTREFVERSAVPLGDGSLTVPSYPIDGRTPAGPVSPSVTPAPTPGAEATPRPTLTAEEALVVTDPKYERREVTTNYEISRQVERIVKAPGSVKRLSVSVLLDGQLDEAVSSTISKVVTAAVGLDTNRGDTVVVASLPFDQTSKIAREKADEEAAQLELYTTVAKGALVVLSILVVLLLVRSVIKGLMRAPRPADLEALGAGAAVPQLQGQRVAEAVAAINAPVKEDDVRPAQVLKDVTKLAQTEPKLVAQIVKSWLDEKG